MVGYNTVFEQEERKDEKTGLVFQLKIKKVAAYHQYYAVQKAVEQTLRAHRLKLLIIPLYALGSRLEQGFVVTVVCNAQKC
jgi:hypothetical protein